MAIIVSGCPRSGTSMMMDQCRIALGEDRIIGEKFPREKSHLVSQSEGEQDRSFAIRKLIVELWKDPNFEDDLQRTKDMNPNGFWECRYTVRGIQWHYKIDIPKNSIIKVVSQGLLNTDPQYVDKIIFMVRHPRQVAKSQERLRRMQFITAKEEAEIKVHTPQMFVKVTYQAALWMRGYSYLIPCLFVNFDDLIASPDSTLLGVQEFLGEGDFTKHTVTPKLKRSEPEEVDHHLWEIAESMYDSLLKQDWDSVISCCEGNSRKIEREDISIPCVRRMRRTPMNSCHHCMSDKTTRNNFRKEAERIGIDWKNRPCLFECGATEVDSLSKFPTIEESIRNNFWKEGSDAYVRTEK